jgi:hypothetical protein
VARVATSRYDDQGMLVDIAVAGVAASRNDDQGILVDATQGHLKKRTMKCYSFFQPHIFWFDSEALRPEKYMCFLCVFGQGWALEGTTTRACSSTLQWPGWPL